MEQFTVYCAGMESTRVERILKIGLEQGIVSEISTQAAGSADDKYNRMKYVIETPRKRDAVEIRLRIGCRFAGLGKGIYFRVDDYGRDWSPRTQ